MLKWLLGNKDNRSDYDKGYAWAKESFNKGMSVDEISEKADSFFIMTLTEEHMLLVVT